MIYLLRLQLRILCLTHSAYIYLNKNSRSVRYCTHETSAVFFNVRAT